MVGAMEVGFSFTCLYQVQAFNQKGVKALRGHTLFEEIHGN